MAPVFRACYAQALADWADPRGVVTLALPVDASGAVGPTQIAAKGRLPSRLEECFAARVNSASFEASDEAWSMTARVALNPRDPRR